MSTERLKEKLNSFPKLSVGGAELTIDFDDLDDFHTEKARKELRETPEVVEDAFKVLCDLLADEGELYVPLEKEFLQRFLRKCKWYPKSALKVIKNFYKYQKNHPEFFENLIPSNERAIYTSGVLTPLPHRTADGVRVVVIENGRKWNPKKVTLNQIVRGSMAALELAMLEPKTQVSGVRIIIDMEGLSLSQVTYFTPSYASAIIEFIRTSLPCRLKGVHIVNQSYVFNMVFAFFKPFIQGKMRERLYFHGKDKASILSYIDKKTLPKKYGGEFDFPEEPLGESFYENACLYDEYFEEIGRYGYVSKV
ncbi:hypothetical protein QAD02_020018 [Eretmocerus hayati]|uniref:Uncharacterized protein n=1 Tax=Eretmocerus hayati TaxID=131215 RepID=A0ACC2PMH0_9HYME|nr:hypothetical protein QAD02_020018 [Eretmocerus hayati]